MSRVLHGIRFLVSIICVQISREVETRCFLRENPIFEWAALYEFESGIHDTGEPSLKVEQDGSDNSLNREARK